MEIFSRISRRHSLKFNNLPPVTINICVLYTMWWGRRLFVGLCWTPYTVCPEGFVFFKIA